jgi:hypothetical protein
MHSWSRTILAFRAAGVLLIGMGIAPLVEFVAWFLHVLVKVGSSNAPIGSSGVLAEAVVRMRHSDIGTWVVEHSPGLLALAAGAYLLWRPASVLVPPFCIPPRSAPVSPVHE